MSDGVILYKETHDGRVLRYDPATFDPHVENMDTSSPAVPNIHQTLTDILVDVIDSVSILNITNNI